MGPASNLAYAGALSRQAAWKENGACNCFTLSWALRSGSEAKQGGTWLVQGQKLGEVLAIRETPFRVNKHPQPGVRGHCADTVQESQVLNVCGP